MAAQHLGFVRRGFGPHTDLSQFPPVTPEDWEFSEEVARTNVELVRGYKRLQNEFSLRRRTGTIMPMNALPRPAANSETNDSAKPGSARKPSTIPHTTLGTNTLLTITPTMIAPITITPITMSIATTSASAPSV